ncbi:MAG: UDP-N-acetylmuramoyl-L-alanyl-D-glutamate--2,6-diaminopimelate ligase [Xanthomonadales bacterium]|nr:UDP-N-acetylmuramoyl-L-alanyl-D-glutamate--2,6-diaminopimelate ligase [Gammaproteobacteria bacterium]MBT8052592.1 UDP-N-acetylmuramoyl-L-alanyl-D-glutamate--2,6-diaminopimelate ligase [Gammaproteobacteria bacterium]NND56649.1 UDP-N-acetylmuramoyl-L-alanyl-D-glutamate--2,6-diaminopimelate ligase [Xanthomonadales bacterium]NNK52409.1 UDP-N-acetylmuramoyl-L-alanyl-D-glutamate--2,6-diaminopimelate ligase [Xanthomonadales bacterium]
MSVQTLLEGWCDSVPNVIITGIESDSRRVKKGQAFLAVAGASTHGMKHVVQAQARGAAVVIHDGRAKVPELNVPAVAVPELGSLLSSIAARFFHSPSDHLTLAGVTGTNGKTSTAHFMAQAWQRTSADAGIIGTIGYGPLKLLKPANMTTPDPISLQAMLSGCLDHGVGKVAMEVSSHALDQGRCNDVAFDAAVLTNLSRDHLDYHGTMEAYAAAKRRLFIDAHPRFAVINLDDAFGKVLAGEISNGTEVFTYGTNGSSELRGSVLQMDSQGMTLNLASPWGGGEVRTGLLGAFNVSNLLAVAGTLALLGMPWSQVMHQLEIMHAVPGRMHCMGGEFTQPVVVVDYAHTPDALQKALTALRSHLHGRLVCVFGCGGDRDCGKRPLMARVAESLSDRIIMTSDNPRGEEPAAIIRDMIAGLEGPEKALVIEDRASAIRQAVLECGPGDIILVAGKGHEAWQELNGQKIPFSDEAAVHAALEEAA